MSRIWNVGLSLVSTTFWLANGRACLYLLFLWCYYERMANHGAILVWSSVLAGAQLRRDVIWYYWVVFTYKGMTSLTRYTAGYWCHELCDLKISWRNYGYFENESRIVLIGFGKCEILSLKDSVEETEKQQQLFLGKTNPTWRDYFVRDALIVISAVFVYFRHLCAAR